MEQKSSLADKKNTQTTKLCDVKFQMLKMLTWLVKVGHKLY